MSCRRIQKQLPLAAGGDLDAADLAVVEAHAGECLPCYRELARFRIALAPLREMRERGGMPKDLLCDVLSAVDSARSSGVLRGSPVSPRSLVSRLQFVGVAAVVFLGVSIGSQLADRAASPRDIATDPRTPTIPFDRLVSVKSVSYPLRQDVFGGASPVLLPALATNTDAYPTDDYSPRIRRTQPSPALLRVSAQVDDY
jgi:predicted anti-sigma-YlaC factor YlaD